MSRSLWREYDLNLHHPQNLLNLGSTIQSINTLSQVAMILKKQAFDNIVGVGENVSRQHFLPSPQCFIKLSDSYRIIRTNFIGVMLCKNGA